MATPEHSKIINKVAREVLKPLGVKRKGQSRTWLDDNGWWLLVIEFQPSSWSKGTYLNVGIHWLWHPKEYFSFDLGYREAGYVEYKSNSQFEPKAREMANLAKIKVEEIRGHLSNLQAARNHIVKSYSDEPETIWNQFHCGMICAVSGDTEEALPYFNAVKENSDDRDWALELKQFTRETQSAMSSTNDFIEHVCNIVKKSRKMKKLEDWDCDFA